ncbi:integrase [Lacticaseibacillus casei A2-362]|jgi:integrase|nr:integrase [Lacticaseibacillus casei A2-362]DAM19752.1 MAG TPA: Integrase [Caudoviricetes sp.]
MMASISKRGKKWQYRVSYKDNDGTRKYVNKGGFPSKKAADIAAIEVERQHNRGANLDLNKITLIDYWDKWIELYKSGKHSRITEARYKTIRKQLLAYWGESRELKSISKSDWQAFINEFGKKRAKDTVSKLNGYVRSMADSAVDDQIIYTNFTHNVVLTGNEGQAGIIKYLQVKDLRKLVNYCLEFADYEHIAYYIIATGALTGARYSEVLGLTWDHVDLKKRVVHITRTWDHRYGSGFAATKNKSSVRDIDITRELADLLLRLKKEQQEVYLAQGYRDSKQLLFRSIRHNMLSSTAINKDLRTIEKTLDISPAITFHGLRHTHVSYLIANHVDINYISKRLGHANTMITQKVYAHLLEDQRKEQVSQTLQALSRL